MFVTQQQNEMISDVDYKNPSQVELLRQQLAHQYENFCYGSKRISVSEQKKYSKQIVGKAKDMKNGVQSSQEKERRASKYDNRNRNASQQQNEKVEDAISQKVVQSPQQQEDKQQNYLYQIEVPKSASYKRKANQSPSPFGSQTLNVDKIKEGGIPQKYLQNQVYLSPLIQNCLEEEIITSEQQRYSSVPSRKYLEMYDYSKDKLQKIYGMTGYYDIGKLNERLDSPKNNVSQKSELYNVEIQNERDSKRRVTSQQLSNISSINYTSQGLIHPQQQQHSPSMIPKIIVHSQRNQYSEGDNTKLLSQKNSREDLKDIKKKIEFTESFDLAKGRGSVQAIKPTNVSQSSQNSHWTVSKKRNSSGLIPQLNSLKYNQENFQFTSDQRHTHQLIKNSGIYLRNKPEYLSDPRYKLIENLNKVSQTVNISNINNHSVREGEQKMHQMSRIIPYCHNFVSSFKESFYHPQTSYENKYKIYNPNKQNDKSLLPHQNLPSRISSTTPRNAQVRDSLILQEKRAPLVTPFLEKSIYDDSIHEVRYPKKIQSANKQTQEDDEEGGAEEFQYYQGSMNRYNCLYLNRNQRVRLSRNSSPNKKKKERNNNVNLSADGLSFAGDINSKRNSVQYEDPRKEYREQQKKLEEMLNVASVSKHQQQDQNYTMAERIVGNQEAVYLRKSRNYGSAQKSSSASMNQQIQQNTNNNHTLDAFVFKPSLNQSFRQQEFIQ